jgi:hypothetical protein
MYSCCKLLVRVVGLIGVGDLSVIARVVRGVGYSLVPAVWQQNVVPALGHVAVPRLAMAEHLRLLAVAAWVRHFIAKVVVRVLVTMLLCNTHVTR